MTANEIDRFRGWALVAFYASLSILCLLLILAAFLFWPSINDGSMEVFFLVAIGAATAVSNVRASLVFFRALRANEKTPKIMLVPFFLMAVTLFATSNLFAGI